MSFQLWNLCTCSSPEIFFFSSTLFVSSVFLLLLWVWHVHVDITYIFYFIAFIFSSPFSFFTTSKPPSRLWKCSFRNFSFYSLHNFRSEAFFLAVSCSFLLLVFVLYTILVWYLKIESVSWWCFIVRSGGFYLSLGFYIFFEPTHAAACECHVDKSIYD